MHTSRGTFDAPGRPIQDLPARILAALTPQEQEQLKEWLDRRALQRRIARRPYGAPVMDRMIAIAATVTEIATDVLPDITMDEDDLAKLVTVGRKFSRALERQGWSLPVTFSSNIIGNLTKVENMPRERATGQKEVTSKESRRLLKKVKQQSYE